MQQAKKEEFRTGDEKHPVYDHKDHPGRKFSEQKLVVSHLKGDGDFIEGFRGYASYRHLELTPELGDMIQFHVTRPTWPKPEVAGKAHFHDCQLAFAYVLKGSITLEFEGYGKVVMREGSCWNQAGVKHKVLEYTEGCEILEINMPGSFDTINKHF